MRGEVDDSIGTSLAMFGAVAMIMTKWQRQASSSEDLEGDFFGEDDEHFEAFVQSIPKVELHVHLDGSFDPAKLWCHMSKQPELIRCFPVEKKLPWARPEENPLQLREMVQNCETSVEYRHLCTCRRRYRKVRDTDKGKQLLNDKPQGTLEDMLTCFEFFFPVVYDNDELLESLAYDFVRRQFEQNVIYTEVRYSPHLLAKEPTRALEAITRGLRRGCDKYQVTINQILCAICFNPQWSKDVVEMARLNRHNFPCAVVGIDVAAGEDHFANDSPWRQGHLDMCKKAKELGISLTMHAGETPDSAQNVRTAIEVYGAKRIGHAYKIVGHEDIMNVVRENDVHIEVCPTSSVETGGWKKTKWISHPANSFKDQNISFSLSSDDPAVFNTSLTWQYRIALKKMGWTRDDIKASVHAAIEAAFLGEKDKEVLREKLREWVITKNPVFDDRVHYE